MCKVLLFVRSFVGKLADQNGHRFKLSFAPVAWAFVVGHELSPGSCLRWFGAVNRVNVEAEAV